MTEEVGVIIARIKADASQLEQEMRRANGVVKQNAGAMSDSFKDLKAQVLALGPALSAVAFVGFVHGAIESADHINDLAQRTGFLGSTLSALNISLKQGGSNLDEFSASMNRMNAMIGEAAKGLNEEAVKAFDGLGLSVKRLAQLSPEQQFFEIATALGNVKSQSELTEKGMNIFGRSFASLIPLIKESKGNLAAFVDEQKNSGNALSQDELDRIDEWGDRWTSAIEHAKLAIVDYLNYFYKLGEEQRRQMDDADLPDNVSHTPGRTVSNDDAARRIRAALRAKGIDYSTDTAKGDNKELLGAKEAAQAAKDRAKQIEDATRGLDDYNRSLEEGGALLKLSDRDAAMQEARFKVEEIARKGNITLTQEEIDASAELAAKNYDLKKAQDEVNKSIAEAARFQQELHDKLSATLTDIVFKAGSAKEAMLGFAESIAKAAFEKRIAGPLADSLLGTGGSGGLLDGVFGGGGLGGLLGFADGGSPPVGVPSIVGERGPEIFVPNTAGTVIPNGKIGGTTVIVQQTINMSPGLPETVNAAIRNAAPQIAAQAQAAVFAEMKARRPGVPNHGAEELMPLYMPTSPGFVTSRFGLETNTQSFTSPFTKSVQRVALGGSRWSWTVSLPAMKRDKAAAWKALFDLLEGAANTFYGFDPDCVVPRGQALGNPQVNGGLQTGSSLIIDGCTPNTTFLKTGDYFSVNGEYKRVTADSRVDGSGNAALTFKPALRNSPPDNTAVIVDKPTCPMALVDDMQAMWECDVLGIYQPKTFAAVEVFS